MSDSEVKDREKMAKLSLPAAGQLAGLFACLQYGSASIMLTLSNRAVFVKYKFDFPVFITLLQLILSIFLLSVFRYFNILPIGKLRAKIAAKILPLSLFWGIYVVSGVAALRYLNVSTYNALRRATPLVVASIEAAFFKKSMPKNRVFALTIAVLGAAVAAYHDAEFNLLGFILVSICVFATSIYLIFIKKMTQELKLDEQTLLLYNNLTCLPFIAVYLVAFTSELRNIASYENLNSKGLPLYLLFACSQAVFLNYSIYRCTVVNSPVATAVTGQLKDYIVIILSALLLNDVPSDALYLLGILLGFIGGTGYAVISSRKEKK